MTVKALPPHLLADVSAKWIRFCPDQMSVCTRKTPFHILETVVFLDMCTCHATLFLPVHGERYLLSTR